MLSALAAAPAAAETAPDAAPTVKLIAFGDSIVAGYGLPRSDGFVPQLQAWLDARAEGPVEVVNAGVSGDTTSGGLSRLDWSVPPDADAVILELGGNDMLRGVDPDIAEANLDEMITQLQARDVKVMLAAMTSFGNWGADYKRRFDAIYPTLAERRSVPLLNFVETGDDAGAAPGPEAAAERAQLVQADGIHPSKAGVARMVDLLGPDILAFVEDARAAKAAR